MNPHQKNKVDLSQMSEQDQKAFKLYGKVPGKNLLTKMQKDRKYFDSGDYMMSKAGITTAPPGTKHPTPEAVPHASPPGPQGYLSSSPTGGLPSPNVEHNHSHSGLSPTLEKPVTPGVGVGISPAATSEAIEMPGRGHSHGHQRRGSESSYPRISPPSTLREGGNPSSFPIHHPGTFGGSPVKASSLAKRVDEEIEQ
ncbi:uncharacterized protein L203_100889 [Cryptococcus depauperatus CBS 7841]|uniref:mRNA stability protein n=1 Tax=Cryptococcus depauperatus CBS 7841 TaxID=1295531 RepID=A0AAJ8LYR4_9TREE